MMSSCRRGGMDNDRVVVQVIEIQKRKEKCGFPTPENLILIDCKVRSSCALHPHAFRITFLDSRCLFQSAVLRLSEFRPSIYPHDIPLTPRSCCRHTSRLSNRESMGDIERQRHVSASNSQCDIGPTFRGSWQVGHRTLASLHRTDSSTPQGEHSPSSGSFIQGQRAPANCSEDKCRRRKRERREYQQQ